MNKIIFIVGLTAVGKTTSIAALKNNNYKLLPNRRELTDLIIIPEIQEDLGQNKISIKDRLERFKLTAKYRQKYPQAIVYALQSYLKDKPKGNYFFDNIRGANELKAAKNSFVNSYFIFLDAPFAIRLQRLIGRNDSFDSIQNSEFDSNFIKALKGIKNADKIFDLKTIAKLGQDIKEQEKIIAAVKIIATENEYYNSKTAKEYLDSLEKDSYIYIDTSENSILEVSKKIEGFIDGINNKN